MSNYLLDKNLQPAPPAEELEFINRQLNQAKYQAEAQKKGFITTCQYFDVENLSLRKELLELKVKHPNYSNSNY